VSRVDVRWLTLPHVDTSPYIHVRACRMRRRMAPCARFTQAMQCLKHASNLTQAISRDKFQPCHWPFVACIAFLALRCMRKAGNCTVLNVGCQLRGDVVVKWSKCRSNNAVLKGMTVSCRGRLAVYPGLSDERLWDNYRTLAYNVRCICILYREERSPEMCVRARNNRRVCRPPVDKHCARWPVYTWVYNAFIKNQNRIRIRRFFLETGRNPPLTRFWEP